MPAGGFQHDAAHEVVDQEVEADFAREVLGRFAAQVIHLEGDLEVAQRQFHLPASQVELGQSVEGVSVAVEQGGDQDHLARAKAPDVDATANDSQQEDVG